MIRRRFIIIAVDCEILADCRKISHYVRSLFRVLEMSITETGIKFKWKYMEIECKYTSFDQELSVYVPTVVFALKCEGDNLSSST